MKKTKTRATGSAKARKRRAVPKVETEADIEVMFRLSKEQARMVERLAVLSGQSPSEVVRVLLAVSVVITEQALAQQE